MKRRIGKVNNTLQFLNLCICKNIKEQKGVFIIKKLKWIGYIIMLVCFYYLIRVILNLDINLMILLENPQNIFLMVLYSLLFCILLYIGAFAWKLIINYLRKSEDVSYLTVSRVFIRANIAKYLPGNVMHFAGRNVLGNQLGWKHSIIALSTFLEISMLFITASLLSLIFNYNKFIELFSTAVNKTSLLNILLLLTGLGIVVISIVYYLYRQNALRDKFKLLFSKRVISIFPKVFFIYLLMFIFHGIIFLFICISIVGVDINQGYTLIIGSYILSWVIGFITPGSPGGIGVRESTILLMLSPVYGRGPILIAALVNRLITIFGDLLAFLIQLFIDSRYNE